MRAPVLMRASSDCGPRMLPPSQPPSVPSPPSPPPSAPLPSFPPDAVCADTCSYYGSSYTSNGQCNDGGPGSQWTIGPSSCPLGSDCRCAA